AAFVRTKPFPDRSTMIGLSVQSLDPLPCRSSAGSLGSPPFVHCPLSTPQFCKVEICFKKYGDVNTLQVLSVQICCRKQVCVVWQSVVSSTFRQVGTTPLPLVQYAAGSRSCLLAGQLHAGLKKVAIMFAPPASKQSPEVWLCGMSEGSLCAAADDMPSIEAKNIKLTKCKRSLILSSSNSSV